MTKLIETLQNLTQFLTSLETTSKYISTTRGNQSWNHSLAIQDHLIHQQLKMKWPKAFTNSKTTDLLDMIKYHRNS